VAAARILEPVSKLDSLRVLDEAGVTAPSYQTLMRRLPAYAKHAWQKLSAASGRFRCIVFIRPVRPVDPGDEGQVGGWYHG
jgi:hypothetical protein